MRSLIVTLLLLPVFMVHAAPMQAFVFDDPEQEEVFKRLSHEIRCLVCQNQSIGDSNAPLATDLREEIYGMLKAGQSEEQIVDFLVQRYGDFVLYNPPLKPATLLLWFGPLILFAGALYYAYRFVGDRREQTDEVIDGDQQERLRQLQQEADQVSDDKGDAR